MRDIGLFLDLDGVFADFDVAYHQHFGYWLDRTKVDPPGFWKNVESVKNEHGENVFYKNLPLMPDAKRLWEGMNALHPSPVILTGVAKSLPNCEQQKREWVAEHISPKAAEQMICCFSKDKCLFGRPGDILVDDWLRYRANWENMGGVFVHHQFTDLSLTRARAVLNAETQAQVELLKPLVSGRRDFQSEPRRLVNLHGMEI